MLNELIDPELLKRLERLTISSKRLFSGTIKGRRRSVKRGSSVEFADYRDYQVGDDLRFVDWNIYARLDKLFLKTFIEEEDIVIHILIDVSKSMTFGSPPKLGYAKRLAAALGYVGLVNLDSITISTFAEDIKQRFLPVRGKDQIFNIANFIGGIESAQRTIMKKSLRNYALSAFKPGVAIIISDFLVNPIDYQAGLKSMLNKNFDIGIIQILSQEEINPTIFGELQLEDSETGEIKEITITEKIIERYKERVKNFCLELEEFCSSNNISYVNISVDIPLEEILLKSLRRENVII
ncbi:DUF58 domain-containing protein [Candidatus Poribacteria bacterium]|nr:DUF58 domain-containing protein [Candidatus Poribacteria bacterium]